MRILVAGIGNIFYGDDGFGPEVARVLRTSEWPADVEVKDFGIRGMDLAFALTNGVDCAILVDAVSRGGEPGTLYVIEPDVATSNAEMDNHAMNPVAVLKLASTLGVPPHTIRLVGCEPAQLAAADGDISVGLSPVVAAAIEPAARLVTKLVEEIRCTS